MTATDPRGPRWGAWFNRNLGRLNQKAVADALGITESAVSKWAKGATAPDANVAVRVARLFNKPGTELSRFAADAVRAAGFDEVVDVLAPGVFAQEDPRIVRIQESEVLSAEDKVDFENILRRRLALLDREARRMAEGYEDDDVA